MTKGKKILAIKTSRTQLQIVISSNHNDVSFEKMITMAIILMRLLTKILNRIKVTTTKIISIKTKIK